MPYFSIVYLLLLLGNAICHAETAHTLDTIKIKVVTEDGFPIQFLDKGKISGPATAFVEQVLTTANISYHIEVLPWARAYRVALNEPNVLIYSLAKTRQRAEKFKWIGEIMTLNYYLYGSTNSTINAQTTLEELKQYRIGAIRDSAAYQYLHGHGFNNLIVVVHGRQNIRLFEADRIDLFPANKSTFHAICQKEAINCQSLKPVYKLDMPTIKLYMAFSQLTDDSIVEKVQAGYHQVLKAQNSLADIIIN